jgi:hypothetical protein
VELAPKLQLKPGQGISVVGAPASAAASLSALPTKNDDGATTALMVFAVDRSSLEGLRSQIAAAAGSDRLTWVAYPKAGQLGTDLNRDSLVELLSQSGIQPVRQVALDEVWSALRFRPL